MPRKKKASPKEEVAESKEKIKSLQEMIATAEKTINSAKQMLAEIQGVDFPKRQAPVATSSLESSEGRVVMGRFDGQIMIGDDGKQYPVPANYASKSKLVEGDMLKLVITPEGSFVYKQIGPVERKFIIGLAKKDERGNFVIKTELKTYKVLLAAATYFKIELGDEVTIVVPRNDSAVWAAIENIVRKASEINSADEAPYFVNAHSEESASEELLELDETEDATDLEETEKQADQVSKRPSAIERLEKEIEEERRRLGKNESILDEWTPDIEQLKKEVGQPANAEAENGY